MISFTSNDRFNFVPEGYQNFYVYEGTPYHEPVDLLKIGTNTQTSCTGRLAWNEYCNDQYHIKKEHGGKYDDEKGRVKITQAIQLGNIVDEVVIKVTEKKAGQLETDLRSILEPYSFPNHINFSGKTEFVYANHNAYIIVEDFFKFLRENYECR